MQKFRSICTALCVFLVLPFVAHPLAASPSSSKSTIVKSSKENPREMYLWAAKIEDVTSPPTTDDDILFGGNTKNIRIINLGKAVNYKGLDYAPTVSADGKTLYFVSDRIGSKLNKNGDPSHDFWASKKNNNYDTTFFEPYNIDTAKGADLGINTSRNEGVGSISADQQSIFFTGCNRPDGIGDCDIYQAEVEGEKWGRPRNLGRNVNSTSWDSQPTISPDKGRLYFASNRPGGVAGLTESNREDFDIWYSDWDDNTQEWKPAVNAGPTINTPGKDWAPFIGADGVTLFFSSNGQKPNMGGTDFYFTRMDEKGNWSKPVNFGAPFNTPQDDDFISLPASGDIVYFASRRTDIPNFQGNYDIFMAFVPSFYRSVNIKGIVVDECSGENIPAFITIYNPVTKKTYSDTLDIANRKEFTTVINNPDFGDPKDSVKVINLEITATNPAYGSKKEIVRVDKPSVVKDKDQANNAVNLPPVTIKLGQRPVLAAQMDFADWVKAHPEDSRAKNYKGLVMEEVITISLYPLLNYVFFDEGSSTLPKRYVLFDNSAKTKSFTDERIPGGTMEKYYNVLNIYGYRLTKFPNAKIRLVGCNDAGSMGSQLEKRKGLSQERAEFVYNYFKNVWGIKEDRMKIETRDLPEVKSNIKDSLGIVENRRVEVRCDEWEVIKPILDSDPTLFPSPETMVYEMKNGIDDNIVAKRRIEVSRGGKPWKTLTEVGKTDKTNTWNWQNEKGEYPTDEVPYSAKLIVTSNSGKECESLPIPIRVMQISSKGMKTEKDQTKTLERYNLVLFPFDRSDAGPLNERILKEYIYPRVFKSSEIKITGHTDVVGLYDRNAKLSQERSKTVENGVKSYSKGAYKILESSGVGEDDPLYNNDLPEGRFYNRTVQIIIRTPLEDTKTTGQ